MPKKFTKKFEEFLNESEEKKFNGRGVPFEEFIPLFSELIYMCPNLERFTYPNDSYGHSSHLITISRGGEVDPRWMQTKEQGLEMVNDKLTKLVELVRSRGVEPLFRVWHISTKKYSMEIEKRLKALGKENDSQNLPLPEVIEFLKQNPDITEQIESVQATIDSPDVRAHGEYMSRGDGGPLD